MKLNELSTSQMALLGAESVQDLISNSSNAIWFPENVESSEKKTFNLDGFKTVKKFGSNDDTVRVSLNGGESHLGVKAYAKALSKVDAIDKDVKSLSFSTKQVENPNEYQTFIANEGKENEKRYVSHEMIDLTIE